MPQMQALADRLSGRLAGAALEGYEPLGFAGLKTVAPPESLVGETVVAVGRRGKYLVFEFGGPRLLIHLSQAGRLDIEDPPKRTKPKGSVVRLRFTDPRLTDPTGSDALIGLLVREHGTERKAGWWVLAPGDDGPLEKLGPEPDSEASPCCAINGRSRASAAATPTMHCTARGSRRTRR
jgi:formamidopyrimidine-DNA glycosylase